MVVKHKLKQLFKNLWLMSEMLQVVHYVSSYNLSAKDTLCLPGGANESKNKAAQDVRKPVRREQGVQTKGTNPQMLKNWVKKTQKSKSS